VDLVRVLNAAANHCDVMGLHSAGKQVHRITTRVKEGNCSREEFRTAVGELKRRIHEDLQDRVFFCVTDAAKIQKFFTLYESQNGQPPQLGFKPVAEAFEPGICQAFPEAVDDLKGAAQCYLFGC
jgi:hypothetical protein